MGVTGQIPRSLVWATEIDVLAGDRVIVRRDGYLVVREPSNPTHWWGNLLLLGRAPVPGDRARWEALFDAEFADEPRVAHRTFAWDVTDGSLGAARAEFLPRGYELEQMVGLIARPQELRAHPRANPDVEVTTLDPTPGGGDEGRWEQVVELWVAGRNPVLDEPDFRAYARRRLHDIRAMLRAGRGSWYVARRGGADRDEVVGSCGIIVTAGRGRYQSVHTAAAHRRQGICSRLVIDAAAHAVRVHGARHLVICADPDYHARGIYQSLGFAPVERVAGVVRRPGGRPPGD
jgi:ribosomal protein S18 acetylase RimI-like enzyme